MSLSYRSVVSATKMIETALRFAGAGRSTSGCVETWAWCMVRQRTGVVEQLLSIDGGLGDVLKTQSEELQRLPMIDRQQPSGGDTRPTTWRNKPEIQVARSNTTTWADRFGLAVTGHDASLPSPLLRLIVRHQSTPPQSSMRFSFLPIEQFEQRRHTGATERTEAGCRHIGRESHELKG
jgi:hypothetical protein